MLYRIPWTWDHHKRGAIIVFAHSKEEAIALVKASIDERQGNHYEDLLDLEEGPHWHPSESPTHYDAHPVKDIKWDLIKEVGDIALDEGCDC